MPKLVIIHIFEREMAFGFGVLGLGFGVWGTFVGIQLNCNHFWGIRDKYLSSFSPKLLL